MKTTNTTGQDTIISRVVPRPQQPPTVTQPDPDSTRANLALSAEDIRAAIGHLELACGDSRVDASVRRVALDALRDALTAVEAELEAGHAQP